MWRSHHKTHCGHRLRLCLLVRVYLIKQLARALHVLKCDSIRPPAVCSAMNPPPYNLKEASNSLVGRFCLQDRSQWRVMSGITQEPTRRTTKPVVSSVVHSEYHTQCKPLSDNKMGPITENLNHLQKIGQVRTAERS